jgi:hypothetical protein
MGQRKYFGMRGIVLILFVFFLMGGAETFCLGVQEKKSEAEESLVKRQRAELLSFYLKSPRDAALPKTPVSVDLYNQAVHYVQSHDYELARQTLKEAIAYDEKNSFAYELMGDLDYLEQHLQEALEQYKSAFRIHPRKELKEKIEKLLREIPVEEKFSTYKDKNFILNYEGRADPHEIMRLRKLLRASYRRISKDFAYYFKRPVVVLLYEESAFRDITKQPHWVGGVYDGKIRLPSSTREFLKKDLKAMVAHEMTHAFVAGMSEGKAPPWIHEGIAVYEENKVKPRDFIVFRSAVKTNTLLNLDLLTNEQKITYEQDPLLIHLFYEQSADLVRYLIEKFGVIRMKQMLTEFAQGKESDEILRKVLGKNAEQLEKEWKASFTN